MHPFPHANGEHGSSGAFTLGQEAIQCDLPHPVAVRHPCLINSLLFDYTQAMVVGRSEPR